MTLNVRPGYLWNETVWNPSMIRTALWLDAADSSTVITVGSNVSQWNDKSGNARNVTQSISSIRPVNTTTINTLTAIGFDGVDDYLRNNAAGLPTGSSARTIFVIYQPLRVGSNVNSICGQGFAQLPPPGGPAVSAGSWFMLQHRNLSVKGDPYFAGYASDLTDSSNPSLDAKIASIQYNGTQASLFRNGTQIAQANLSLNTTGDSFHIGVSPQTDEWAHVKVGEIVFISSSTDNTSRQRMEGYLAHKWGLEANLPADHPYKTTGPTP